MKWLGLCIINLNSRQCYYTVWITLWDFFPLLSSHVYRCTCTCLNWPKIGWNWEMRCKKLLQYELTTWCNNIQWWNRVTVLNFLFIREKKRKKCTLNSRVSFPSHEMFILLFSSHSWQKITCDGKCCTFRSRFYFCRVKGCCSSVIKRQSVLFAVPVIVERDCISHCYMHCCFQKKTRKKAMIKCTWMTSACSIQTLFL